MKRKKMYFCKLIIKCIVYDRLRKYSRQDVQKPGGDSPTSAFTFIRLWFEIYKLN